MARTTLSSKGQVVLPKEIRDAHHWGTGTTFAVESVGDSVLLRPVSPFKPSTLEAVTGMLRYRGRAKSVRQMDKAIDAELKARRDRGRY
jgi:AbrB family looped-hinge helix DNA binding protein